MKQQPYVIVLAGNTREGHRYAKRMGLPRGRHRVVFSAKQIRHLRYAEIHELPSFKRRPDRHSINAALRYAKGERKLVQMPPDPEADKRGPLKVRQLEVAHRYNRIRNATIAEAITQIVPEFSDTSNGSNMEAEGGPVIDQGDGLGPQLDLDGGEHPVERKARRRTRCKVCGELHFPEEPHIEAEDLYNAAPVEERPIKPTPSNFFGG